MPLLLVTFLCFFIFPFLFFFPFSAHSSHVFLGTHYQNPLCTLQRFQKRDVVLLVNKNTWNEISSIRSIDSFKQIGR